MHSWRFLMLLTVCWQIAPAQVAAQLTDTTYLAEINGTQLFVRKIGQGEPIVFVHGGPGLSHDYFLPSVQPLAEKFQLIFFDQRASGRSDLTIPQEQVRLAEFAADIDQLLHHLALPNAHILGHSFGGLIAMKFATEYSQRVKSLILCNSVSASKEFDELIRQRQQAAVTSADVRQRNAIVASAEFREGSPAAYDSLFRLNFKRSFYDTLLVDELVLNINENFPKSSKLLSGLATDLQQYDYHPALSSLEMPVLVVHGAADLIPLAVSNKLVGSVRDGRLVVFEKTGHFPFIERPDDFASSIGLFIEQASGR